jgi:hypothetical protein
MNQSRLKVEHLLYAAAFVVALAVRLVGAEATPLSDREAGLALQALALAHGQITQIGPHPAYLALTTALMFIFQAGNWVVRFWPALAGSLLVLMPALFRERLGRQASVLLAFFLALDPGLLTVSRTAGGPALALTFTLLAFGLWVNKKIIAAGLAAGMALLSGPQVWPGLLGLGAVIWVASMLNRPVEPRLPAQENGSQPPSDDGAEAVAPENEVPTVPGWRPALIGAFVVVFFVGTLFFTIPDGLSAMADSLPAYLSGWASPSGVPLGLLLVALLLYELFPLAFGLLRIVDSLIRVDVRGISIRRGRQVDWFLTAWWAVALLLALVYPGRQVETLAWSLLPLWGLAARQVTRMVSIPAFDRLTLLGQMILTAVILGYISISFASSANGAIANAMEYRLRLAAALVMLFASTGLIAWGWSRLVAIRGFSWGLALILLFYMISAGWNAIGLSGRTGEELWRGEASVYGTDLLRTIGDFKQWSGSDVGGPDLVVVGNASPALQWLLRGLQRVSYSSQLPADSSPALVITPGQPDLSLAATYRGQNFFLAEMVNWNQLGLREWLGWLFFRSIPVDAIQQNQVILWARVDLFPGGLQSVPAGGNSAEQVPPK